ncbi:DUF6488 family protein [Sphingorhabdus sp. SMR4y]|uniref:DUF6488 family protein n=1 Tax=Sphingorhabdus sp. SMR4y TaxID=2584094 RepID=UPI000B5C8F14|nr:DUF6488 family protein [Sphingorhabdus sp. SMR4y]ASK89642.1 hypothetical protein SPHFLASMR4Y_02909 [Sphingorhabdus sp. SMR4y]
MRNLLVALTALATVAGPALGHPRHDEMPQGAERKPMAETAKDAVIKLVTQAKLPSSWSKAKAIQTEARMIGGTQSWVVTFDNPAIKSAATRKLYVVLTKSGEFVSAAHTAPK